MYENVPWAVDAYDAQFPERLKTFILSKYSSMERAIEHLQVSSSAMYSYLRGPGKSGSDAKATYPSVPFLLKLSMLGCNLHWLLTGDGDMLVDVYDKAIAGYAEKKKEALRLLVKSGITDNEQLAAELALLAAFRTLSKHLASQIAAGTERTSPEYQIRQSTPKLAAEESVPYNHKPGE